MQIGMKQEMELSMKMLEKDICEKQDALVALRQQLDDLRSLNHEFSLKSQVIHFYTLIIILEFSNRLSISVNQGTYLFIFFITPFGGNFI